MEESATAARERAVTEDFEQRGAHVRAKVVREDADLYLHVERHVSRARRREVAADAAVAVERALYLREERGTHLFRAARVNVRAHLVPTARPVKVRGGALNLVGPTALGEPRVVLRDDGALQVLSDCSGRERLHVHD